MVRGTERADHEEPAPGGQPARDAPDPRDLEALLAGERRQESRQSPREHRLARAGRARPSGGCGRRRRRSRGRAARRAWPRTSERSGCSASTAERIFGRARLLAGGFFREGERSTAPRWSAARTSRSLRAAASGSRSRWGRGLLFPRGQAASASERTPGTGLSAPSSPSSPTSATPESASAGTSPLAARIASATARSSAVPISAGRRERGSRRRSSPGRGSRRGGGRSGCARGSP